MRRLRGFTLIELITVMVLVGIIAAVVGPRFFTRNQFDERGFYDQVANGLRYAQRVAISSRREVCVALAPGALTLTRNPGAVPGAACTGVVTLPGEAATYAVAAPTGVVLGFTNAAFRFNGLGQPVADPGGGLLPDQAITVTGSTARTLTVRANTGYVQ